MKLFYFLPASIWGAFILIISLTPSSKIPSFSLLEMYFADKIIHFVMYLIFTILISTGFYLQKSYRHYKNYLFSILVPLITGGLTEFMQDVITHNRSSDIFDMLANLAGIAAGILLFRFTFLRKMK